MADASVAICFVLANPPAESRLASCDRRMRSWLQRLPWVGERIPPRWSPERRQGYGAGLRACVNSLRRRHERLPPILVLRPASQQITLADVDEVVPFEPSPARRGPRASSTYFGREVFHKLEVFNLRGYERVIYLDCDTVVLDDISPLWDPGEYRDLPFYAVRETAEQGVHPATRGKLNTGVMVINRPLLDGRAHDQMLTIADSRRSYDGGDQGVVNAYLENAGHGIAGELDPSYNVLVRAKRFGKWELLRDRIRILHYVNRWKPWSENHARDWLFDPELKRLWDDAYRVPQRRAGGSGAPRP